MNDDSILGGVLNQLGQTVKQTVKQVIKIPEEMAADVGGQIGGVKPAASAEGSSEPKQKDWKSDEERVKFLKDLYGTVQPPVEAATDTSVPQVNKAISQSSQDTKPSEFQEQIADKSPEEQKKLMELRQQLHKDVYYDPTFNPVKKQEERPAEKVENEKKQEMQELQEKDAKKPPPIAVQREQNKAEMFRGASG